MGTITAVAPGGNAGLFSLSAIPDTLQSHCAPLACSFPPFPVAGATASGSQSAAPVPWPDSKHLAGAAPTPRTTHVRPILSEDLNVKVG